MNTIELFKNDLWNGIWLHAKKLFKPLIIVMIVYFLVSTGLAFWGISTLFGPDFGMILLDPGASSDPDTIMEMSEKMQDFMMSAPQMLMLLPLVYLVLLFLLAWFTNFLLMISQSVIENGQADLGATFQASLNSRVWRTFAFMLIGLVFLVMAVVIAVMVTTAISSVLVGFLSFFLVIILTTRLVAGPAAIVHGDANVAEAFGFSWTHITFGRAAKLLVVVFVFSLLVGLVMLALSAAFKLAGNTVNIALSIVLQIALTIVMYSLMYSGMSATWYRYADIDPVENHEESEHLIEE